MPPRRSDAPRVEPYTRGNRQMALALASDPSARSACSADIDVLAYATTSAGPRAQRHKLWGELLQACGVPDPWDLSPETVSLGAGLLRRAGYRSAMAYVDQAYLTFQEQGGQPTAQLSRSVARARRACERGIGPPKHSAALPLERLSELSAAEDPWSKMGPSHPRRTLLLGCWWLTREIELGNATIDDIHVVSPTEVRWNLPASKADPRALGAARSHSCACGQSPGAPTLVSVDLCPHCNMLAQLHWALARAQGSPGAPLFPNQTGSFPSKAAVVQTITHAASTLLLDLVTTSGSPAWGGHAMRRGGAQYLASAGVDVWRIQALARHSSSAILIYLGNSIVASLGNIAAEAAAGRSLASVQDELRLMKQQLEQSSNDWQQRLQAALPPSGSSALVPIRAEDVLDLSVPDPVALSDPASFPYVLGTYAHSKMHIRDTSQPSLTYCRWQWSIHAKAVPSAFIQGAPLCQRCAQRACNPRVPLPSSSSSSSSSSEAA